MAALDVLHDFIGVPWDQLLKLVRPRSQELEQQHKALVDLCVGSVSKKNDAHHVPPALIPIVVESVIKHSIRDLELRGQPTPKLKQLPKVEIPGPEVENDPPFYLPEASKYELGFPGFPGMPPVKVQLLYLHLD